jgi:diguanylate cyclase (GGDEF)-like protein
MGSIILNSFRKSDISGRIGGEEFAVILKNTSLDEAKMAAEKVRKIIARRKVIYGDQEIRLTVSIGVAAIRGGTKDIKDIEDFLKMADDALYKAKAGGRNAVVTLGSGTE